MGVLVIDVYYGLAVYEEWKVEGEGYLTGEDDRMRAIRNPLILVITRCPLSLSSGHLNS